MKKILIVEDEKDLVEVLSFRLEKLGFKVFSAFNGKSGLATAKQELPDLIILDVMLPVMDGYRVCKELKERPFDLRNTRHHAHCEGSRYGRQDRQRCRSRRLHGQAFR